MFFSESKLSEFADCLKREFMLALIVSPFPLSSELEFGINYAVDRSVSRCCLIIYLCSTISLSYNLLFKFFPGT